MVAWNPFLAWLGTWAREAPTTVGSPVALDIRLTGASWSRVAGARLMRLCLSPQVLEESKCLVRSFLKSVLEDVNEKECLMLKQLWSSSKGLDSLFSYLQDKIYEV